MAFIVKKNIHGNEYFYLNENKRVPDGKGGTKVKTKTLAYLGKTKKDAEKKAKEVLKRIEKEKARAEESSVDIKTKEVRKEIETKSESKMEHKKISIEEMAAFCKRKGFVYQSGEIYGGLAGFYDYGHLGTPLKKNFEKIWKGYFLGLNDNFFEIEASEIMPENVFVASGHLKNFIDVAAKCKKGHIERADHLLEKKLGKRFEGLAPKSLFNLIKENKISCNVCGSEIESVSVINMMFPIHLGTDNGTRAFLRPETAQSPYINFKLQFGLLRNKLPLGLALIGKAYRNELSPRNFVLRQRAFTQAELQIFFNPSKIREHENFESIIDYSLKIVLSDERNKGIQSIKCSELTKKIPQFYVYHMAMIQKFYFDVLGFPEDKFRFYELNELEKAFYNKYHFDMEAELDSVGWTEIGGIHYRTDHDLKGHHEVSKESMEIFDEQTKEKFIPHVLELSFGLDRNLYTILNFSYFYDKERENTVLKLHTQLAPIKAAVFPIVRTDEKILNLSKAIYTDLRKEFSVVFDSGGSIGRRYSRNDEIGTPFCITVDEESLKKNDVTIRDRDTTNQIRIKISELKEVMAGVLDGGDLLKLGRAVSTRVK